MNNAPYRYFATENLDIFTQSLQVDQVLIRKEYVLVEQHLAAAYKNNKRRPRFVLTGQPGIGKTTFLLYLLIERLQRKSPTVVQTESSYFLLFDEVGVHRVGVEGYNSYAIPTGAWALMDSNEDVVKPCQAFLSATQAMVIQASSPQSRRWKDWKTRYSADLCVMDVWDNNELDALFAILKTNASSAKKVVDTVGCCPRTIFDILKIDKTGSDRTPGSDRKPESDRRLEVYVDTLAAAAQNISETLKTNLGTLKQLDFSGSKIPSGLFFVHPSHADRLSAYLDIPTNIITEIVANAVIAAKMTDQMSFFNMMSSHASSRASAGCVFEIIMHDRISKSSANASPLTATSAEGQSITIPVASRCLEGTMDAFKQCPLAGYWRPSAPNFPGIDGVVFADTGVFALQATIARNHTSPAAGLKKIWDDTSWHTKQLPWHLVFVAPTLESGEHLRNAFLRKHGNVNYRVFACGLISVFGDILNERYMREQPEGDSDGVAKNVV
jgi:RHS (Retrotransposon Hot Spot) family protein